MMSDWELPVEGIAELPHKRDKGAIAGICNNVINNLGKEQGPQRVCVHICGLMIHYPNDPVYVKHADLWMAELSGVCKKRGVEINVNATCNYILSAAWECAQAETDRKWKALFGTKNPRLDELRILNLPEEQQEAALVALRKARQAKRDARIAARRAAQVIPQTFEERLTPSDAIHARGMRIELD